MLQKWGMLTPIQEQALALYDSGKTLREVADKVGRSHEWVRKTLLKVGDGTRERGREPLTRPTCPVCREVCNKPGAKYCSRLCLQEARRRAALSKLQKALRVLRAGGTYVEAAQAAGFQGAWHLWGRLYHFGLTEGLSAPVAERIRQSL